MTALILNAILWLHPQGAHKLSKETEKTKTKYCEKILRLETVLYVVNSNSYTVILFFTFMILQITPRKVCHHHRFNEADMIPCTSTCIQVVAKVGQRWNVHHDISTNVTTCFLTSNFIMQAYNYNISVITS